jgi:hypothetical protein
MTTGGFQLISCCSFPTTPIFGPSFPGQGVFKIQGNATTAFTLPVESMFLTGGVVTTPCYSNPVVLGSGRNGVDRNLASTLAHTSAALTSSNFGSYAQGIQNKVFSGTVNVPSETIGLGGDVITTEDALLAPVNQFSLVPCGSTLPTQTFTTNTFQNIAEPSLTISVEFAWLGVAQRDLPGIRLKKISGLLTWTVEVSAGVVTIKSTDGVNTFTSSGTLLSVVTAINASSIAAQIQARVSGWGGRSAPLGYGETNGDVAVGKTEFDYLYTKNDLSTRLKDLGTTFINPTCFDSLAPFGFQTSTRLPVFVRGDLLPPQGVVFLKVGSINYFNTLFALHPQLKLYDNTEEGALSFITEEIYLQNIYQWGGIVTWDFFNDNFNIFTVNPAIGWIQVFTSNANFENQTRTNPGASVIAGDITPTWSSPITTQLWTIQIFGTCPYIDCFNTGSPCYDSNCISLPCFPDLECTFGSILCLSSGCFSNADQPLLFPCSTSTGCTNVYEFYVPGDVMTLTLPVTVPFSSSTSISYQIL